MGLNLKVYEKEDVRGLRESVVRPQRVEVGHSGGSSKGFMVVFVGALCGTGLAPARGGCWAAWADWAWMAPWEVWAGWFWASWLAAWAALWEPRAR